MSATDNMLFIGLEQTPLSSEIVPVADVPLNPTRPNNNNMLPPDPNMHQSQSDQHKEPTHHDEKEKVNMLDSLADGNETGNEDGPERVILPTRGLETKPEKPQRLECENSDKGVSKRHDSPL